MSSVAATAKPEDEEKETASKANYAYGALLRIGFPRGIREIRVPRARDSSGRAAADDVRARTRYEGSEASCANVHYVAALSIARRRTTCRPTTALIPGNAWGHLLHRHHANGSFQASA